MEVSIQNLRNEVYKLLLGQSGPITLMLLDDSGIISKRGQVKNITWVQNGGLIFTTISLTIGSTKVKTTRTIYYWPNATDAYRLIEDINTLINARSRGNTNPEIDWILNQKVAELKEALNVIIINTTTWEIPTESPEPSPINPKPPITILSTEISGGSKMNLENLEATTSQDDWIRMLAIKTGEENEGTLEIKDIHVEPINITSDYVTYRVVVYVKNNMDDSTPVEVLVEGTKLSDYQSIFIYPKSTITVTSVPSGKVYGDKWVTVSGTIKVTYTLQKDTQEPNNVGPTSEKREIIKSYSKTIHLEDIDPNKIYLDIKPQDANHDGIIETGEDVTFKIIVRNDNKANIGGTCTLNVEYPISSSDRETKDYITSINVPAGQVVEKEFEERTSYHWEGTFHYEGHCVFGQYFKNMTGSLTVVEDGISGGMDIKVRHDPESPQEDQVVKFVVDVSNNYASSKEVEVRLLIDNTLIDSVKGKVDPQKERTFVLEWSAVAGDHDWRIEVWEDGKLEASRSEGITVSGAPSNPLFNVEWEVYPQILYGGGTVFFKIYAWNFMENPLNVSFTSADTIHFKVITNEETVIKEFNSYVPEGGVKYNVANFTYTFYGVGNYTFILTADWGSETHTRTARVEVKPTGNILASMDCNPTTVPLDSSTTCTIHLGLKNADTVTLNLEEVDFGGRKVWPTGPSSVRVNKQTMTLTPTTMQGDLTITININDELADYYFGHWGYTHKLLETHSYRIEAYLEGLSYPVSDVITITGKEEDWKDKATSLGADFVGGSIVAVAAGSNPISLTFVATFIGGVATTEYVVKPLGTFLWDLWGEYYWGIHEPGEEENDNNSIIGG
ncbi:hypothetical protein A3L11_06545 [Thermococcus siculi]|uniref:Uncharacterized protein n=2 Tax=Thermococcus siculi TaxID=72803 RepID=A0A2Z2MN93_9EURY|nr:hypothetical protein A3L11_06545 [Thermococcus siculi]